MRKISFVEGEYYHIYNRGVDKRDIFQGKEDIKRFIESMREFNQVDGIGSIANIRKSKIESKALFGDPLVSIVAYCLNPNHFHFILKQSTDGGISKFMQKLQGGYTYFFNAKNTRSGALFQGTFKSHLVSDENYFNKIIAYVNNNYQIHTIPKDKKQLVFSSDYEYKNNDFKIVTKKEGEEILKIFNGIKKFEKHCKEIISIIRKERGVPSLLEEDYLPDRV
jgi:REP element-mobilizing transposase RayT